MINYFDSHRAAALYAKGRPYYQHGTLATVAAEAGWKGRVPRAIDVACGTGLSTRALLSYADEIIGVDASRAMLSVALPHPRINYREGRAEQLPVEDGRFDLLSLCDAFHWLDQSVFLSEVRRVLKADGRFLLYGGGMQGIMDDVPEFTQWFQMVHLPRYPTPLRQPTFRLDNGLPEGFHLIAAGRAENGIPTTIFQLADFFLSVSNTLEYLEQTGETTQEHRRFLVAELMPFYYGATTAVRTLRYRGEYFLMRKDG